MLKKLIKLADKLDAEGKHDLAEQVDETIAVFSARKKAPMKHLDEKVKKDLVGFVHKVEKSLDESAKSLEELFRRLRYFDLSHLIKETGLDKMVGNIKNTHSCIGDATKKIYELSYGKRPGKGDVEQMVEDIGPVDDALSFFESQQESEEPACDACNEKNEKEEEKWGWEKWEEHEEEEIPADFWEGEESIIG
jgi:hypothetical protein